ncbi:MAG: hypothetical protein A3F11_03860 [Gammaproteobacteria bacterium RIFCSPHIGHO2_12_FULL_37_14]|nr:MAG: hypothetical protein A3F11_03860 [Gammaproteobacteria bacterium RIFCSPHIGHO2_12_FULL_37_14]
MINFYEIPKIDLSPLLENSKSGIVEVANQIRDVYMHVGFAYILNHGIPESLVNAIFGAAKDFHNLPSEEKLKIKQNKFFRGYMPIDSSILKVSSLENAIRANQSEAFILAHEVDQDNPDFIANDNLAGPNQWPQSLPKFKEVIKEYEARMLELMYKLIRVVSVAFGMAEHDLDQYFIKPTTFLRLQYYPPQPELIPEKQFGIAPHTDYGFITLLAQDDVGGLQVLNQTGDWIEAPPLKGSFMLNSGDMLKRLSNDIYLSTPHRVINRSGVARYSIPFFFEPNMHAIMKPLPIFCTAHAPAKYEAMEYHVHLMKRIRNNYEIGA